MPQYYNGGNSPFAETGFQNILKNYSDLVSVFGDPAKVIFGFCIEPGLLPFTST
jgi:hypothetical protein